MNYFAKSRLSSGKQPTVGEHCDAVAKLAEHFGNIIGFGKETKLAALFHDFGKYSNNFQGVLKGTHSNIDHAIGGASILQHFSESAHVSWRGRFKPIIEAINGHHNGLLEYAMLKEYLDNVLKEKDSPITPSNKQSSLFGISDFKNALNEFIKDHPHFSLEKLTYQPPEGDLESMLYTRMLFSCLVDADYCVSASDENPTYVEDTSFENYDFYKVLQNLYLYREEKFSDTDKELEINKIRNYVFEQCGDMGDQDEGLYTLTAPTGTAKTLALIHFALRHCLARNKKRIIIVLPFLTLTEQNAAIYKELCEDLIEDHSQSRLSDEERDFAARWSSPIIVTTSVRFFESLFSNHPSDCRKLHHIANSVVVFDEAQSLPADLAKSSIKAINELCSRYRTTVLFSTATQPNYEFLKGLEWKPVEIIPEPQSLYDRLRRVKIEWKVDINERKPLIDVAHEMSEETSVCTIVNLRRHARKLYRYLKECCPEDEIFFITTDLCSTSRRKIIAQIHDRLDNKLPCRVVATQCIEAGVDFSFEVMYRALAPLDAISQAAGRCCRHGEYPNGGRVIVFIPKEPGGLYPSVWYQQAAQKVQSLCYENPLDINDLDDLRKYYELLFTATEEKKKLAEAIDEYSFEKVDREYRFIEQDGLRVIVPVDPDDYPLKYEDIRATVVNEGISKLMMKICASISVQVSPYMEKDLENIAEPLYFKKTGRKLLDCQSGFYILRPQYNGLYSEEMGLQISENTIDSIDFFL